MKDNLLVRLTQAHLPMQSQVLRIKDNTTDRMQSQVLRLKDTRRELSGTAYLAPVLKLSMVKKNCTSVASTIWQPKDNFRTGAN